jgi:hypothetical protein
MSDQFGDFDCVTWLQSLQARFPNRVFNICNLRRGSSIVDVDMPLADADTAAAEAADGSLAIPRLISVTDPTTGEVYTLPTGLSIGIIIAAAVGGLLLITLIIILIVYCCRRHRDPYRYSKGRPSSSFNNNAPASFVPLTDYSAPAPVPASALPSTVMCRLQYNVVDQGDSILCCNEGDVVAVSREDFRETGEWCWASFNGKAGYVPRSYLIKL